MRLFVAVGVEGRARKALSSAVQRLKAGSLRGSFTRPENFHLTLAFLGQPPRLSDAKAAVQAVEGAPFSITLRGLDRFARPQGDIWWVGAAPSEPLVALHAGLRRALEARGFPVEHRPFLPHLTLGHGVRTTPNFDPDALAGEIAPITLPVNSIALMESASPGGVLTYLPLLTHPLAMRTQHPVPQP